MWDYNIRITCINRILHICARFSHWSSLPAPLPSLSRSRTRSPSSNAIFRMLEPVPLHYCYYYFRIHKYAHDGLRKRWVNKWQRETSDQLLSDFMFGCVCYGIALKIIYGRVSVRTMWTLLWLCGGSVFHKKNASFEYVHVRDGW